MPVKSAITFYPYEPIADPDAPSGLSDDAFRGVVDVLSAFGQTEEIRRVEPPDVLQGTDGEIRTATGIVVDPFNLDPGTVRIEDIAHALARVCRFNGHTEGFLSVAGHSLLVAQRLNFWGHHPLTVLCGLMHDATEAYLCDIPGPVKHRPDMLPFREAEDRAATVIAQVFGLPDPFPRAVKLADVYETKRDIRERRHNPGLANIRSDEEEFLRTYEDLRGRLQP